MFLLRNQLKMNVRHPAANNRLHFNIRVLFAPQINRLKNTSIFHVVIPFVKNVGQCILKLKLIKVRETNKSPLSSYLFTLLVLL